ncbi:dTDP-4-dehydrorhamnose 3,5-epimerase [bacterium]|nr:dTDP-4-dehydrorhamnose 3,5-epimerase [bacterium]
MRIIKTKFKGLFIIKRSTNFDNRGFLRELFEQKKFSKKFVFDYFSLSKKNVIRGLHLQLKKPQTKIISVISGKIFDVVVDCRKTSRTFGKHFSIYISANDNTSLYIPEGFAHGFCSLASNTILYYKNSNYRSKNNETGILWNDKNLKIKWPINKPILSLKDKKNLNFNEFLNRNNIKKKVEQ